MKPAIPKPISSVSEFLILPDGRILAQNITPPMAKLLSELNPEDKLMRQRAKESATGGIRTKKYANNRKNFQTELLKRSSGRVIRSFTSFEHEQQESRVQSPDRGDLRPEAAEKGFFEWSYSTGIVHRPELPFNRKKIATCWRPEGPVDGAGPGHRTGRAGHFHFQGFSSVPDEEQLCRDAEAQGNCAAFEEQFTRPSC